MLGWFALLILVPSVALLRQVLAGGLRPFFETLATPEVRRAFGLTLGITALATVVNTVFGIALALVLVRQRFWGRALLDGVVDLPFAVSPVVAGLDADRALRAGGLAGPLAGVVRGSGWSTRSPA